MEDLCERPRKLIHKDLRSQYLSTLTYKDTRNISRNMRKASSSQLLPLPTDIEETHEALSTVQYKCEQVRQNLLVNDSDRTIVMFSWKNNLEFLAPLMGFTLTGHLNQHRSFSTNYLQFLDSLCETCIFLPANKHPTAYEDVSDIRYQRLQNLVWMFLQQLFMLTSKPPFTTQWQQCGQAWKLKNVVSI